MAEKSPPNNPDGEAGKVKQEPQRSQQPNITGDVGQKKGQQTNVELMDNIRKTIIRAQRLVTKDPTGKMATKQLKDAKMKIDKILKSK